MRILIISIGGMGDVLRTTFVAQGLRDKYKKNNPQIYWITDKKVKPLLLNNPYINHVISKEEKDKIKTIGFDIVINLEEKEEICKFASSLNSKKLKGLFWNKKTGKVDYGKNGVSWFDMSLSSKLGVKKADNLKKTNRKTHREMISEIAEIEPNNYEPFIRLTTKQRNISKSFLRRHNLSRNELIIGINTGSADTWPKDLSTKKTAQLIDKIYEKYKAKIILFGGPNEVKRNQEIYKHSKSPIIDAGCGNDLEEFPAIISVCNAIITTDSLGLHIALGLKRKTIALVGPTSPYELDMYNLGEKISSKSNELATYRKSTRKCMDKIEIKEILDSLKSLLKEKITIVITSFNEPKTIGRAIEATLNQNTKRSYEIIVSAPDEETLNVARKYSKKNQQVKIYKDPGKGKSYALNLLFQKIKTDILILTDGDVWINEKAVGEISNLFLNPEIGCITGRPCPIESRKSKYGYWANFLFKSAHLWRKQSFEKDEFIECSGYLFAFRKNYIDKIPLDVAEDTIIPYFFWEKGFNIGYAEEAKVYVKNVDNWKDWVNQKIRTSKAHEKIEKYVDTKITPKMKSFKNESKGIKNLIKYPENFNELIWTIQLALGRLYMWGKVYMETKLTKGDYSDGWKRVQSTK